MTTTYLFKNNAISTLSGPISNTATTINMASGSGVLFPSPSGSQVFTLTLVSATNSTLREIVYCTNVSGDALTVVRAQEGTTALSFLAGDIADHRLTAGALQSLVQSGNGFYFGTDTGSANALAISVPAISALAAGTLFIIKKSSSANTAATTINVNGLGAQSLVWADTTPLIAGDWPASVTALLEYDGAQFNLLSVMGPSIFARKGVLLNVQTFTASGTYTKTPGTTTVVVEMVGGGASGGSVAGPANASLTAISGGGTGGTYGIGQFTATAANGATITIGAAGAGAAIGNNAGNAGGASSFGALMSCPGGVAGLAGSTVAPPVAVGGNSAFSAAPTGANLGYLQGGLGGTGIAASSSSGSPARGGDSFFGRGGQTPYALSSGGVGYGSGGSGVIVPGVYSVGVAGGSGTPGFCRVWEYA